MDSVWSKTVHLPHFEALQESKKTDVLIIGGGMAGVLCAYFLQEKGVDYMLVEGRRICSGVTKNTTAKITAQHGLIYGKLLKHEGAERAGMYLEANLRAVEKYGHLCCEIDCDFEEKTSYIYSKDAPEKLEEEAEALHQIGYEAKIVEVPELPFRTAGAVAFAHQAQFHPLKFIAQIAKGLTIYENTFVTAVKDHTAVTEKGNITFKKVIFATHFPIDNKHGLYFM
ncbi:MAG: FAD-binding oxidoreductase, partial [Lachnospiraceae bacterium]|nr:FAD-binding oxidoreductase [Lachnospiraceae bacterium]